MSRIGIRILIGQYIELHRDEQLDGYVGLINRHTSPAEIFAQAVEDAKYLCERTHGDSPDVILQGRTDLTFSYIPVRPATTCTTTCQRPAHARPWCMDSNMHVHMYSMHMHMHMHMHAHMYIPVRPQPHARLLARTR